ncbi:MAG: ABC transporter ATP-binding protein [Alphaproteobacteria bacterium]
MPSPSPRRHASLLGRLWQWYDGLLTIDQPKPDGPTPNRLFTHLRYALGQTRIIGPLLPLVSILSATASAIIPLGVAVAIDTFVLPSEGQTDWPLVLFIAVLIVAFVVPVLLEVVFLALMMPLFHAKFVTLMKRHMHKHLQGMSWRYFQNEFAGRIGTKVNAIGQSTHDLLHIYLDQVFYVGTLVLVSLGVLAYVNIWLMVPMVLWMGLFAGSVGLLYPIAQRKNKVAFEAASTMNGALVDTYTNAQTVQLFARNDVDDEVVIDTMRENARLRQEANIWFFFMDNVLMLLNYLLIGVLFGVSILLWSKGWASAGAIAVALPIGLRVTDTAHWVMRITTSIAEESGTLQEALDTIAVAPDMVDEPNAPDLVVSAGQVRFEGVGYEGNAPIVEGLSFEIQPGEKIALVGPSGAGKTSLTSLLLRLFDVDQGRVMIDGQDIARVNRNSLRQQIAMVTQDTSLLHRSVADNIRYGQPEANQAVVEDAARRAGAHEFILDLRDNEGRAGYDARVGERGVKLSGGQRQRIALARVLLKDAPIVVFDEATSALDSETEALLQEQLALVSGDKTVITIAHRLSTIQHADRIFVMDAGRIVQEGSHDDLIKQDGLYAELWSRQAGGFSG